MAQRILSKIPKIRFYFFKAKIVTFNANLSSITPGSLNVAIHFSISRIIELLH